MGFQDDFSEPLQESLEKGSDKIEQFAGKWGKNFFMAGGIVVSALTAANVGVAKFLGHLVNADDALNQFARDTGLSRDEAYKTKSALDAMGKSMEEIRAAPALLKQFEELRAYAQKLKPPDMSASLEQIRGIGREFTKLKQTGMAALEWIGHHLLKNIAQPLGKIQGAMRGLNDSVVKNLPAWSEKIGEALSWVVRLGMTLIRGAGDAFKAIKKVFDMIPGNVKLATAALAAFGMFIRAGPVGKLVAVLSAALALLDDFYTYLDGGDSLLGSVWQTLIDLFGGFTKSGKNALDFFSGEFLPGLFESLSSIFQKLVDKAMGFVDPLVGFAVRVLDGIITVITKNLPGLVKLISDMAMHLLRAVLDKIPLLLDGLTHLGQSLISGLMGMLPGLIDTVVGLLQDLLAAVVEYFPDLVDAGIKLILSLLDGILDALPAILDAIIGLLDSLIQLVIDLLPQLIEAGIQIVLSLMDGIAKALPQIIQTAITLFEKLVNALLERLPDIIQAGITILMALIQGLVKSVPKLIQAVVKMIPAIVKALIGALPQLIQAGIEMVIALVMGVIDAIPQIVQTFVDMIPTIVQNLIDMLPQIIEAGITMLMALIEGLINAIPKLVSALPKIMEAIISGLVSLSGKLMDIGKDAIRSLWDGICSMGGWIKDKVSGFFGGIWDGITDFFGGGEKPDPSPKPMGGHAEGGVFDKEHVARFAEDDQPEAVIPLTKPKRAAQVLQQIQGYLGEPGEEEKPVQKIAKKAASVLDGVAGIALRAFGQTKEGQKEKQPQSEGSILERIAGTLGKAFERVGEASGRNGGVPDLSQMAAFVGKAGEVLERMNQTITTGAQISTVKNTNSSHVSNTKSVEMKTTYNIYDSSGNPQSTAKAVDRQQQLRMRNMQEVLI